MADDTLPIVFRSRRLTGFVMTAVGAGIVAAGIAKAADDSFSHADDHFGPIVLSSQTTGWLMIAIGLPFALYALVTVVRGCPTLRLDDTGLLLSRCLQVRSRSRGAASPMSGSSASPLPRADG